MHRVLTSVLKRHCNPFEGCWPELESPLSFADVQHALDEGRAQLHAESLDTGWGEPTDEAIVQRNRHAEKVAWFVLNEFNQPIEIDVGAPALGCYVDWIVTDGNHRLAAAIFVLETRGEDRPLPANIGGQLSHAKKLGL